MMARIWNAYRVELYKAARTPIVYGGPILLLVAVLGLAVHGIYSGRPMGYTFIAFVSSTVLGLPALLIVFMFGASLTSQELQSGTARLVLTRPLRRVEFLAAKWLMTLTYGIVTLLAVSLAAWIAASATSNLAGLTIGGDVVHTGAEMQYAYVYGMALFLAPLMAASAYSLLLSVAIPNPAGAVGGTVAVWLLGDLVKYPLRIEHLFFWTFWGTPWAAFQDRCNGLTVDMMDGAGACLATSLGTVIVAGSLAMALFRRRNV